MKKKKTIEHATVIQKREIYNLKFIFKTFVLFLFTTCVIFFITFTSLKVIKDWSISRSSYGISGKTVSPPVREDGKEPAEVTPESETKKQPDSMIPPKASPVKEEGKPTDIKTETKIQNQSDLMGSTKVFSAGEAKAAEGKSETKTESQPHLRARIRKKTHLNKPIAEKSEMPSVIVTPIAVIKPASLSVKIKSDDSVKINPDDAEIKFLSTEKDFSPGMEIDPGKYHLEVSATGYESKRQWVEIKPGENNIFDFQLTPKKVPLFLKTMPDNATVRFFNTEKEFSQGMEVVPGKYHLEVSAKGYESKTPWIEIKPGENKKPFEFKLDPKKGCLFVNAEPKEAEMKVNRKKFSRRIELNPGPYTLEVSAKGYEPYIKSIVIYSEEDTKLDDIKLKPIFSVTCNVEDAEVYIDTDWKYLILNDWIDKGKVPYKTADLKQGKHKVKVWKDGYTTFSQEVEIKENGKPVTVEAKIFPIEKRVVPNDHSNGRGEK